MAERDDTPADPSRAVADDLVALAAQMDAAQARHLHLALVRQAADYAERLLPDERADIGERVCLSAVRRWLAAPDELASGQAIEAALERDTLNVMGADQVTHSWVWDAARAVPRAPAGAAALALGLAAEVARRTAPLVQLDPLRGPTVAGHLGRVAARRWQVAAARAILAGAEPAPEAMPALVLDRETIFEFFGRLVDARAAHQTGDVRSLLLLMTPPQQQRFDRLALRQAIAWAEPLLPLADEDHGERACLDSVRRWLTDGVTPGAAVSQRLTTYDLFRTLAQVIGQRSATIADAAARAFEALVIAGARQWQADLAQALEAGRAPPIEPGRPARIARHQAAYRDGRLRALVDLLDDARRLRLRQALVGQAHWYATQARPAVADDRGHRACLEAARRWASQPTAAYAAAAARAAQAVGASPDDDLAVRAAWVTARATAEAATRLTVHETLSDIESAIVASVAATQGVSATSQPARVAAYQASDYQLEAAWRLVHDRAVPVWTGPTVMYAADGVEAWLRQLDAATHDRYRRLVLHHACGSVERAIRQAAKPDDLDGARLLVVRTLRAWADGPTERRVTAVESAIGALHQAAEATHGSTGNVLRDAVIAFGIARHAGRRADQAFDSHETADYAMRAISFAANELARRWQLDAAAAVLNDTDPPILLP